MILRVDNTIKPPKDNACVRRLKDEDTRNTVNDQILCLVLQTVCLNHPVRLLEVWGKG